MCLWLPVTGYCCFLVLREVGRWVTYLMPFWGREGGRKEKRVGEEEWLGEEGGERRREGEGGGVNTGGGVGRRRRRREVATAPCLLLCYKNINWGGKEEGRRRGPLPAWPAWAPHVLCEQEEEEEEEGRAGEIGRRMPTTMQYENYHAYICLAFSMPNAERGSYDISGLGRYVCMPVYALFSEEKAGGGRGQWAVREAVKEGRLEKRRRGGLKEGGRKQALSSVRGRKEEDDSV